MRSPQNAWFRLVVWFDSNCALCALCTREQKSPSSIFYGANEISWVANRGRGEFACLCTSRRPGRTRKKKQTGQEKDGRTDGRTEASRARQREREGQTRKEMIINNASEKILKERPLGWLPMRPFVARAAIPVLYNQSRPARAPSPRDTRSHPVLASSLELPPPPLVSISIFKSLKDAVAVPLALGACWDA